MKKLNSKQQRLVEENHNLIYGFAQKKKLEVDEVYDILALGLCRAALTYDEEKSSFSTWAFMCMSSDLNAYFNRQKMHKRKLPEGVTKVYLDQPIKNADNPVQSNEATIGEFTVAPSVLMTEVCEGKIIAEQLLNLLEESEQEIVKHKLNGLSDQEVGNIMGCGSANINYHIQKIRRKWNRFYYLNFVKKC